MGEQLKDQNREDKIRISEEVVATIAGIAASEDENVASMSAGFIDGIAGMIGKKTPGRGIKVEMKEDQVNIDIAVIVRYGCKIHEVARSMQARVRKAVEDMTGLKVNSVNVGVTGVNLSKEGEKLEIADEIPPQA